MKYLDANFPHFPSMVWARTIKEQMGGISYGMIQRIFSSEYEKIDPNYWSGYSRRIYKNHRGTQVTDSTFINKVDKILPGTKRLLSHPFWKIMDNPEASLAEIYNYMNELSLDLRTILFHCDSRTGTLKRKRIQSKAAYISKINNLDALACLLMMIREAEIIKHVDAYIEFKWKAHHLICRIATFHSLKDLATIIYDDIFELFIEKNNPLPPELSNEMVRYAPYHYKIPEKYIIQKFLNENLEILKVAVNKGIIKNTIKAQLDFLFFIDCGFKRIEIMMALLALSEDHLKDTTFASFPPPLNEFMKKITGNRRRIKN